MARHRAAHGDPDAFIRSHVRRLEAFRRAGHVERIDADHWKIPGDIAERGIAYDAPGRPKDFGIRTLSTLDLDRQVGIDGGAPRVSSKCAMQRKGRFHSIPRRPITALERQEIERVGKEMAAGRGLTYSPSAP